MFIFQLFAGSINGYLFGTFTDGLTTEATGGANVIPEL